MALEHKDIKSVITAEKLKYSDDYFTLSKKFINVDNCFNYFAYNALKDVVDVKSNNYSNLILTKKQKNSNLVECSEIKEETYPDFVTTLSFFSNTGDDALNPGVWLAIDKGFDTILTDTTSSSFKLIEGKPDSYSNYLMRVECIDDVYCLISHTFGDATYYLVYDDGFKMSLNSDKGKFIYHINDDLMNLYRIENKVLYIVGCKKENDNWILILGPSTLPAENVNIFINNFEENVNCVVDASWVSYNSENALNTIDVDRSKTDLETQFLIHSEYADENNSVNLVPLKNNLTYQGSITNGGVLEITNNAKAIESPQVDYRNYATINSGTNQETGSENITLSFTFSDQVYRIEER